MGSGTSVGVVSHEKGESGLENPPPPPQQGQFLPLPMYVHTAYFYPRIKMVSKKDV